MKTKKDIQHYKVLVNHPSGENKLYETTYAKFRDLKKTYSNPNFEV